ncbi:MAG: acyl transferase [Nonlabens sp.]|uniref:LuxE/PaaK family acyltransferase n=1 Tax=Nonlabens sp. TaxID=1888209 RepID=UPI003EF7D775
MFDSIFHINSIAQFEEKALAIFHYQLEHNKVYGKYCQLLKRTNPQNFKEIPFLPISFFKSHQVISNSNSPEITFTSSGTTGMVTSKHHVTNMSVYDSSLDNSFKQTYGRHEDYAILALLPHYLERNGSSLVYMAQRWIEKSNHPSSGFYLNNIEELAGILEELKKKNQKVILIGVTFALLQLAEQFPQELPQTIIIETGGMKGMRKEIIKQELHEILKSAFAKASIQSEYGMTELLSQAYATDGIHFETPSWMKVLSRDTNDPLTLLNNSKTGGLNIIDLANYNSCSFIATQDLGKVMPDGTFQVLGRFDQSDIRGCNLMAVE